MALSSDAAMVLYYDISGNRADHDDWHTYEHIHERLSIPGFLRATRWILKGGEEPYYMVVYEVSGIEVGTSPHYLERLNNPTPWTMSMMGRFRGMIRGFCSVAASSGFGIGHVSFAVRFTPQPGEESRLAHQLGREIFPALSLRKGMAGLSLFRPVADQPMTKEQSIRGTDTQMNWMLLITAYSEEALHHAIPLVSPEVLQHYGASPLIIAGTYALHFTATAQEILRTPAHPPHRSGRQEI